MDGLISTSDLKRLENYLDRLFAKAGLDIEFTRHFFDRVNDKRNGKPISLAELKAIWDQVYQKYAKTIAHGGDRFTAIIKDLSSAVNIPIVVRWGSYGLEVVAKTVMRKQHFTSPGSDKRLAVKTGFPSERVIEGYSYNRVAKRDIADALRNHGFSERKARNLLRRLGPTGVREYLQANMEGKSPRIQRQWHHVSELCDEWETQQAPSEPACGADSELDPQTESLLRLPAEELYHLLAPRRTV